MRRLTLLIFGGLLVATAAALLVEWRRSYASTGEFTCGWHRDATLHPHAKSTALTVLSRAGHVDVSLLQIPTAFAPQALEGYLTPDGGDRFGAFVLAERHLEPAGSAGSGAFKLERVDVTFPRGGRTATIDKWELRFPHWLAAALAAAASALSLGPAWRRWNSRRRGLCVRCGYDLRSSTDRCPECGEPMPPAPTAADRTQPSP